MELTEKVADVFRTNGQPTVTYVERDSGTLERRLNAALDEAGVLCLLTGPSKTGKTTLYKKVLSDREQIPLVVQCTKDKNCLQIWREALEGVNFSRAVSTQSSAGMIAGVEAELATEVGWGWLAKASGKIAGKLGTEVSEDSIREKILSDPAPDLLIPVLKATNYVLVLEDFHYLDDKEKVLLFQQWKRFVDNEVTVIVLGTSHRAVDIANSNKDLVGRVAQIDVSRWDTADLISICSKGLGYLKATLPPDLANFIATEAVGLPIVVQQVCLELFANMTIYSVKDARKRRAKFDRSKITSAFFTVATSRYSQFEAYYNTLIRGPREKARKYRTYELVLLCFVIDPIRFSLTRSDIDDRLNRQNVSIEERPPAASVNSTLGALKLFQDRRGFVLLEWMAAEDTLYIVEPSFLFYVRWRKEKRNENGEQLDLFQMIFLDSQ